MKQPEHRYAAYGPRWQAETARERSGGGRRCSERGCDNSTREGKPYCEDHLALLPHAGHVMLELARREREIDGVKKKLRRPTIRDVVCAEILYELRQHGDRTVKRLSRDVREEPDLVGAFVDVLFRAKLVTIGATNRGDPIVGLAR